MSNQARTTVPHPPEALALSGEDTPRRQYMTQTILAMMSAALLVFSLPIGLGALTGFFDFMPIIIMALIDVPVWLSWWLARQGQWRVGSVVAPGLMFGLGLYGSYLVGLATIFVMFYALAIFLAAILLGNRAMWFMLVLSLVAHVGLGVTHDRGPLVDWLPSIITFSGALLGFSLLQWFSSTQMQRALARTQATAAQLRAEVEERQRVAEALRQSEEQYRLLADNVTDVIWRMDLGMHVTYVSPSVEKLNGWKPEEWATLSPEDFLPPASLVTAFQALQTALDHHVAAPQDELRATRLEIEQRRRDGTLVWTEVASRLLIDENGEPQGIIGVTRNIDDRRRAEQALRERQHFVQRILDAEPGIVYIHDLSANRNVYANQEMTALLGYLPAEAQAWDEIALANLLHPDDAPRVAAYHAQLVTMGEDEVREVEFRVRSKAGPWVWLHSRDTAFARDEAGLVTQILGVAQDITQRRQSAEALRESEMMLHSLVESLPQNVYSKDSTGRFLFANQRYCTLQGTTLAALVGKTDWELHPPELAQKYLKDDRHVMESGQIVDLVEEHQPLGQDKFYVRVIKAPLYDAAGQIAGTLGVFWDITDQQQAAQEREYLIAELQVKNEELERFTYTVSHDLKAPLITIRGFLGLLEKDVVDGRADRVQSDMRRIVEATDKMQRLLNELLEMSRIGRIMNPPQSVPLAVIVREVLELVHGRIEAHGVKLEVASTLPMVYGDHARLIEVMQNLIDNACKFMGDQPEPRITIGQQGNDRDGKPIVFVRDNGSGIDPQYHEKVFGLFNKLDAKGEGTGVGLALVKRIIEVHGGRIWVESQGAGTGTTFYFSLPHPPLPDRVVA